MGRDARAVALEALLRIDGGAYANLALQGILGRAGAGLSASDRGFVTELVYGTTRMRRACDWVVDRFMMRPPDATTRAVLRLGAYQLVFLGTPAHAAVSETVALAPGRTRGLVNAVLRKVAVAGPVGPTAWPDEATRLSYPDWIVDRVVADLGPVDGPAALAAMNVAPHVTTRDDGYTQDLASQWVVSAVTAASGPAGLTADLCAGPGGKATGLAGAGASVVALDVHPSRARLVASNIARLGSTGVAVAAADGTRPPLRAGSFDTVLVDAPCSGLGVLRRRPDARWRMQPAGVTELAELQRSLLTAAVPLLRPGGVLAYSVCTLTAAETVEIDSWLQAAFPELAPLPLAPLGLASPWTPAGRGGRLLPQDHGTDGMFLLLLHSTG